MLPTGRSVQDVTIVGKRSRRSPGQHRRGLRARSSGKVPVLGSSHRDRGPSCRAPPIGRSWNHRMAVCERDQINHGGECLMTQPELRAPASAIKPVHPSGPTSSPNRAEFRSPDWLSIAEEIARTLPKILRGSVHAQWVTCGKPGCRCSRGHLHGPYLYLFWRERGRLRKSTSGAAIWLRYSWQSALTDWRSGASGRPGQS